MKTENVSTFKIHNMSSQEQFEREKAAGRLDPYAIYLTPDDVFESEEYPGCFYRVTKGVVEWINPPMVIGVEYRTTERHYRNGISNPVYTKRVNMGAGPATGASVYCEMSEASKIVRAEADAENGIFTTMIPSKDNAGEFTLSAGCTMATRGVPYVQVNAITGSLSNFTCYAQVWYTKNQGGSEL